MLLKELRLPHGMLLHGAVALVLLIVLLSVDGGAGASSRKLADLNERLLVGDQFFIAEAVGLGDGAVLHQVSIS